MPGVCSRIFIILSNTSRLLAVEDASGNSNVMYKRPSSSVGIKPVGLFLNNIERTDAYTYQQYDNIWRSLNAILHSGYILFVVLRNRSLNQKKNLFKPLDFLFRCMGLSITEQRAGVSDRATKAEIKTEIAIVIANCWYNLPTMPGINPTGTNTAARINAMATTGPEISFMAL